MGAIDLIDELKVAVQHVVEVGAQVSELEHQTLEAEAEVLGRVIDIVKPVMPLIDEPIENERGVVLLDNFTLKEAYTDKESKSEFGGFQIILTSAGQLWRMDRSGEWSSKQGRESEWTTAKKAMTPMEAVEFGLRDLVGGLVEAFRKAEERIERRKTELAARKALIGKAQDALAGEAKMPKWDPLG
jgi:hypothetical protein